jgi:hypothetical protein
MSQTSFGRRPLAKPSQAPLPVMTKFARPETAAPRAESPAPSVDDEVREWKKSRGFTFPLKPIALMASLSFGIASFVLPADINAWAEWPLYGLSAASLYVGFRRKARTRV